MDTFNRIGASVPEWAYFRIEYNIAHRKQIAVEKHLVNIINGLVGADKSCL